MDYAFKEDGYSHIDQFMNWTIKYFFYSPYPINIFLNMAKIERLNKCLIFK